MANIKAVVFDSDGTLINSLQVIIDAYGHVAHTFDQPVPTEEAIREQLRWSYPLAQILQTFFASVPVEDLLRVKGEYIVQHAASMSAFTGIKELLTSLKDQGLKLAIVTGGNHKVHNLMQHHGFDQIFTSIVHSERVTLSKPDPEGFRLALQECGVRPSEAVMVGDSPNDILAGKNGQAAITIGICHGHGSRDDLLAADADYVVGNVKELHDLLLRLAK